MPACARLGDICTGHGCYPPRPNVQASPNVYVNGIPVHRDTDAWASHCCDSVCHSSVLARGSPTVFVNALQCGRIGDPVACGSNIAEGSGNVFVGP